MKRSALCEIGLSDGVAAPFEDRSFVSLWISIEYTFYLVNSFYELMFVLCHKKLPFVLWDTWGSFIKIVFYASNI